MEISPIIDVTTQRKFIVIFNSFEELKGSFRLDLFLSLIDQAKINQFFETDRHDQQNYLCRIEQDY